MKRPQYVFRPNLNEPQHRRAWALLQQVPPAKRKEFLVQSILAAEQTDRLEKSIRKVVREELQAVNITGAVPSPLSENENEEAGRAEAVVPDDAPAVDPVAMLRGFVTDRMRAAYTPEEIEAVLGILLRAMAGM